VDGMVGFIADVKKPQLTIGYSAALTGEEKSVAQHSGNLVMHLQRQASELPGGM
jgi:hypothetical protein